MLGTITMTATIVWYFVRKPKPRAMPLRKRSLSSCFRSQLRNISIEAEKKKTNIVSGIVSLESQTKPGMVASRILETKAVLDPYIRRVNSNKTPTERMEKVTETSM